jgi:hypothetical protein
MGDPPVHRFGYAGSADPGLLAIGFERGEKTECDALRSADRGLLRQDTTARPRIVSDDPKAI